jgi:hypothetical protein
LRSFEQVEIRRQSFEAAVNDTARSQRIELDTCLGEQLAGRSLDDRAF